MNVTYDICGVKNVTTPDKLSTTSAGGANCRPARMKSPKGVVDEIRTVTEFADPSP